MYVLFYFSDQAAMQVAEASAGPLTMPVVTAGSYPHSNRVMLGNHLHSVPLPPGQSVLPCLLSTYLRHFVAPGSITLSRNDILFIACQLKPTNPPNRKNVK